MRGHEKRFWKRLVQRLIRGHNIEALEEVSLEINQRSQYIEALEKVGFEINQRSQYRGS